MERRVRAALLCLSLLLSTAAAAAPVAAAEPPSLTVTADGETMADGDRYSTATKPRLAVDASVAAGTPANVSLVELIVRVNGKTVHRSTPDGRSVETALRPSLSSGNNTVRVIVIDSADGVESTQFTVYKDGTAPFIYLQQPYETRPLYAIPDGEATGVDVTFEGNLIEESTVQQLTLSYENGGNVSETRNFNEPDDHFETTVRLARGENNVTLAARDSFDNTRQYRFVVNVTDGAGPELRLDDIDTETTAHEYTISGSASDDVWVREVTASFDKQDGNHTVNETVVSTRSYADSDDRREVSFSEDFLLELGTYDVTVTVTDHTGNETTRTFTVNRTVRDAEAIAPEVRILQDRTLFIGNRTLFVSATATDGETERVSVETRNTTTNETLDYTVVHSGRIQETVEFATRSTVGPGVSTVIVRATDASGAEHTALTYVNATSGETFVSESGTRTHGVRITPLSDGDPRTASANVLVDRVEANESVRIPPDATDRSHVTRTANVTLTDLSITPAEATNFTLYVSATEGDATLGSEFTAATDATAVGTVTVEHAAADDALADVTFRFRVNDTYLNRTGVAAQDLTLYRRHDGNWTALETSYRGTVGDQHVVEAHAPGLSVFALGSAPPTESQDGGDSQTDGGQENASDADDTGGDDGGTAKLSVTNVTKNTSRIVPNGTVLVNATVENSGTADGTYTAGLALNVSIVDTKNVTVPPNESRTVTFEQQVAEEGNYTVLVNGSSGGFLLVKKRGLVGSLVHTVVGFLPTGLIPDAVGNALGGLPLKLIGMALGGLVGVIVVASLGLRLLQRLGGGSGESE
ncbi:PGF-pre-PGF domain-containing protein [Haloarculaceae archaeon H-GB2-1]|nr:PGF-pre-PGF domain-containing protein [Haloarculaceae archaeon H-GB1-1]MEA5387547.1 PGF-pre-PGF domain-containing protein [Haloarculaceae archaeon H-GB11]MEA5409029.1 PGF-pre-PGF domain-containing protein [Haloarculaceae archaeon H-GB2-1]